MCSLLVFTFLTDVETFHRTMIAHHSGVYEAFGPFFLVYLEEGFGFELFSVCLHEELDFGLSLIIRLRRIWDNIHVRR